MKVYLLNPPYYNRFSRSMRWQETARGGTLYYPIWLAYATGLLEERCETRLVDAVADGFALNQVIDDVTSYDPDVIVVDSSYTSWRNDVEVGSDVKEAVQDAFLVMVGPPTEIYGQEYLKNRSIDAVAVGEYDLTLRQLTDTLQGGGDLRSVPGLILKEKGEIVRNQARGLTDSIEIDHLPWVSKVYAKHLNVRNYFLSSALYPEVQIIAERGCPYLCTFCEWPQIFTKHKYRSRTVTNVIEEMLWVEKCLPDVKEVVFEDDTFSINRTWAHKFCDTIIAEGHKFTWSAQIRADVDEGLLRKMRKAGCRLVIVGFESGNDQVLKNMKKGITVEQSRKFAKSAKRVGILLHGDFIIGMVGETKETIEDTRALIRDIRPEILQIAVATPFPGTEFYDYVKHEGYLLVEDPTNYLDEDGHQIPVINYPNLSRDKMLDSVDKILKEHYLSFSYVPLAIRQILRRDGWQEFKRLWYSGKVFLRYANRGVKDQRSRMSDEGKLSQHAEKH